MLNLTGALEAQVREYGKGSRGLAGGEALEHVVKVGLGRAATLDSFNKKAAAKRRAEGIKPRAKKATAPKASKPKAKPKASKSKASKPKAQLELAVEPATDTAAA